MAMQHEREHRRSRAAARHAREAVGFLSSVVSATPAGEGHQVSGPQRRNNRSRTGAPSQPEPPAGIRVTLINRTPHPVNLYHDDTTVTTWPPQPASAPRVGDTVLLRSLLVTADGPAITVATISPGGAVPDLPAPRPGTFLIVSRATAAAARHREDLIFPIEAIRNATGHILGCRAFGRFPQPATRRSRRP